MTSDDGLPPLDAPAADPASAEEPSQLIAPWRVGDGGSVIALVDAAATDAGEETVADLRTRLRDVSGLRSHGGEIWVARQRGDDGSNQVVGLVSAVDLGDDVVVLRDLLIAGPWRGARLAEALLYTMVDWAESYGMHMVISAAPEGTPGVERFFAKRGFEAVDLKQLPTSFHPSPRDGMFFRRQLRSSPDHPETVPFDRMEWKPLARGLREKRGKREGGVSLVLEVDARLSPDHPFPGGCRGYVMDGRVTFVFPTHESTCEQGQGFIVESGRQFTMRVADGGRAELFIVDDRPPN